MCTGLEGLINTADTQQDQALKLSEETFEVAYTAQKKFIEGDPQTKKEILAAVQSNLTLKDKMLRIEAKKPFRILENAIYPDKPVVWPIEPEKTVVKQTRKTHLIFARPQVLGDLEEVRNLQRIQSAAGRIYQYFKSQLARPPNDTEH